MCFFSDDSAKSCFIGEESMVNARRHQVKVLGPLFPNSFLVKGCR